MKLADIIKQIRTWGFCGAWNALRRKPHEFIIKKRLKKSFVKNRNTVPVPGMTIVAPISGAFSLSKTMRDFVIRLKDVNIPVQVFDTFFDGAKADKSDYKDLITPPDEFNLMKYTHTVEMLTSPLPDKLPLKRCRIAFWEGLHGVLEVFPYLRDSYCVIAMSDFNAEYFRRELPANVKVAKVVYPLMPLPIKVLDKSEARKKFGFAKDDFIVFYNFDNRAKGRKNIDGTLTAFANAFAGEKNCKLVLKINGLGNEEKHDLDRKIESLGIAGQVTMMLKYLSEVDLYSLTNCCDVYISLHRAEGFGLGIAEAMQLGKAVIATDYSANTEFCKADNSILIPANMIEVQDEGFIRHMKYWAEPDIDAAAEGLTFLRDNLMKCNELGCKAKLFVEDHFSNNVFVQSIKTIV